MYKYFIDDVALNELNSVENVYINYFAKFGDPSKGKQWADDFYAQYRQIIETLKINPYKYHICNIFPFDQIPTQYRYFTVGWFTVFYTVEPDCFIVWHVMSSRADFSQLI
jgi:hypothetical protein